jgi:hypothetical protein
MKTLLTTLFIAMLAVPAVAVDSMGVSAAMDTVEDYILVDPGVPFDFYVVLIDPSSATIGGYECGLGFQGGEPFVLAVTGPNGWTNFGDNLNHLVGYMTPVQGQPVTVLATLNCLVSAAPFEALVTMGPSTPSSFGGEGPGYSDGVNPEILVLCTVPADGIVGIISTEVVATESHTLTGVKALFD